MGKSRVKKLGCVNAAFVAHVWDKNGKEIGTCMDTPNNIAYAFYVNKKAAKVTGWLTGETLRKDRETRLNWDHGSVAYHSQFVKFN